MSGFSKETILSTMSTLKHTSKADGEPYLLRRTLQVAVWSSVRLLAPSACLSGSSVLRVLLWTECEYHQKETLS
jgi:hypothetical protein